MKTIYTFMIKDHYSSISTAKEQWLIKPEARGQRKGNELKDEKPGEDGLVWGH